MKFTEYFEYTRIRPDRIDIKEEWIANGLFLIQFMKRSKVIIEYVDGQKYPNQEVNI